MAKRTREKTEESNGRRGRVSQADVPFYPLTQALRVPTALADHFGMKPARPLQVAQAINLQPTSSGFRMLCGSAIAYGLTEGGYNAAQIGLTGLGERAVRPTGKGDDAVALREAFLRPRVLREFLQRYDGAKVPRKDIAQTVLAEMGVPAEVTGRALEMLLEGARTLGFLREISGAMYVDLQGTAAPNATSIPTDAIEGGDFGEDTGECLGEPISSSDPQPAIMPRATGGRTRVFISHGKNMDVVGQIKTMLNVAEVEYEVAVEEEVTAIPVPEKVLDAMRKCNAAIICVTADPGAKPPTGDGSSPCTVNQNVLIEIGAASVLYNRRVILLWDKRISVPSNLQGLYRCEFEGAELSWTAGMKVMEAVKKFRS